MIYICHRIIIANLWLQINFINLIGLYNIFTKISHIYHDSELYNDFAQGELIPKLLLFPCELQGVFIMIKKGC